MVYLNSKEYNFAQLYYIIDISPEVKVLTAISPSGIKALNKFNYAKTYSYTQIKE